MTRVSTAYAFQNGAADFMRAQSKQLEAQRQIADGKRATDVKGFGRQSETLIAAKTVQARASSFVEMHKLLSGRLEAQGLAMERVSASADDSRQLILSAVSSGRGDGLMQTLDSLFGQAVDALNWKHEGRYLFAGSQVDVAPVDIDNLVSLNAAPATADAFENDHIRPVSRLNETTTAPTGFLANEIGTELFEVLKSIQDYHETTPFNGVLTEAQETFLKAKVGELETAHDNLLGQVARNGLLGQRVDAERTAQTRRVTNLDIFIADTAEVDLAEAYSRLQQAELATQASASALKALKESSLLNFLPI